MKWTHYSWRFVTIYIYSIHFNINILFLFFDTELPKKVTVDWFWNKQATYNWIKFIHILWLTKLYQFAFTWNNIRDIASENQKELPTNILYSTGLILFTHWLFSTHCLLPRIILWISLFHNRIFIFGHVCVSLNNLSQGAMSLDTIEATGQIALLQENC